MNSAASLPKQQLASIDVSPALPGAQRPSIVRGLSAGADFLLNIFRLLWAQTKHVHVRHNKRRLRVCESVPLGDKRFVAVIQVDDKQFLVGGSVSSVSLLAQLDEPAKFSTVLQNRIAEVNA